MKKSLVFVLVIILSFSSISFAFGYIAGSSNLGPLGYPEFRGTGLGKPQKPFGNDKVLIQLYRQDVIKYLEDAKNYIEAARNDIKRIENAIADTENKAKSVIDEYNYYITFGY